MSKQMTVLQLPLSDGASATLRASHPLTATTIEEVLAYLTVYRWVLQRKEAQDKTLALTCSILSWWQGERAKG